MTSRDPATAATVLFDDSGLVTSVRIADWALSKSNLGQVVASVLGQMLKSSQPVASISDGLPDISPADVLRVGQAGLEDRVLDQGRQALLASQAPEDARYGIEADVLITATGGHITGFVLNPDWALHANTWTVEQRIARLLRAAQESRTTPTDSAALNSEITAILKEA